LEGGLMVRMFGGVLVLGVVLGVQELAQAETAYSKVPLGSIESRVNLDVTGGLATTGGDYAGTFLLGVDVRVDRTAPVYVGFHTGVMFGSGTGLPILMSVIYRTETRPSLRPYIGAAVGPVIGLGGNGVFRTIGGDSVRLAILVRGGLSFRVADALDVLTEVTSGGLTGIFYIAPMLGMSVYL